MLYESKQFDLSICSFSACFIHLKSAYLIIELENAVNNQDFGMFFYLKLKNNLPNNSNKHSSDNTPFTYSNGCNTVLPLQMSIGDVF